MTDNASTFGYWRNESHDHHPHSTKNRLSRPTLRSLIILSYHVNFVLFRITYPAVKTMWMFYTLPAGQPGSGCTARGAPSRRRQGCWATPRPWAGAPPASARPPPAQAQPPQPPRRRARLQLLESLQRARSTPIVGDGLLEEDFVSVSKRGELASIYRLASSMDGRRTAVDRLPCAVARWARPRRRSRSR